MAAVQSTYSMVLCQLLIKEMERQGLTQQGFFERSGISQATWSRINRGLSHLGIEDLRIACDTLGLEMAEIVGKAEAVVRQLPEMEVEVIPAVKSPRGAHAKAESSAAPSGSGAKMATAVIAGAALAFLISRIVRS